jgi:hypothetical protein
MKRKVVIHQPNFFPYIGFFEQIRKADIYIAFDDVQFVENEFQNRNFIKCMDGKTALTLPVKKKGRFGQLIKDVELTDGWMSTIMNKLDACYRKSPYFKEVTGAITAILDSNARYMVDVNLPLLEKIFLMTGLNVEVLRSSSLDITFEDRIDRLIKLMKAVNAELLIAGTGAALYLDKNVFLANGYDFEIHEFKPRIYPQLYGDFISHLSVIDYIMNAGWHLKSV